MFARYGTRLKGSRVLATKLTSSRDLYRVWGYYLGTVLVVRRDEFSKLELSALYQRSSPLHGEMMVLLMNTCI